MTIHTLHPCGLFAREVSAHAYVVYAAEGEGFGAGEPWNQIGDGSQECPTPTARGFVVDLLRAIDPAAVVSDCAPDDRVVVWHNDTYAAQLVSDAEFEALDAAGFDFGYAENGDSFAGPVEWLDADCDD